MISSFPITTFAPGLHPIESISSIQIIRPRIHDADRLGTEVGSLKWLLAYPRPVNCSRTRATGWRPLHAQGFGELDASLDVTHGR